MKATVLMFDRQPVFDEPMMIQELKINGHHITLDPPIYVTKDFRFVIQQADGNPAVVEALIE